MITTKESRVILNNPDLTDEEIKLILEILYSLCEIVINKI